MTRPLPASGNASAICQMPPPSNAKTMTSTTSEKSTRVRDLTRLTKRGAGLWFQARLLHASVNGPLAALRRDPRNNLIRICNIARLAVDAVGKVDGQITVNLTVRLFKDRFVNFRGAKVRARITVFDGTFVAADVRVGNMQMARLIFFVDRAAVIHVGELVERDDVVDGGARRFFGPVAALLHPFETVFA